jgi:hypothetical protein
LSHLHAPCPLCLIISIAGPHLTVAVHGAALLDLLLIDGVMRFLLMPSGPELDGS